MQLNLVKMVFLVGKMKTITKIFYQKLLNKNFSVPEKFLFKHEKFIEKMLDRKFGKKIWQKKFCKSFFRTKSLRRPDKK